MTFPVVATTSTGEWTSDTTAHPITLPAGVTAGDLLLVLFSVDGINGGSATAGWTKLGELAHTGVPQATGAIFWKIATGSDALTITISNQQATYVAMRITGATGVTGAAAQGNSTNGDPPSHTAPTGGDNLWIVTWTSRGTVNATAPPAGFSGVAEKAGAGLQTASSHVGRLATAGAALDPGTFTNSSRPWVCWTLAVTPPAGGKAKVWNGTAWAEKPAKVWNGTAWVEKPVKLWTGSGWVLS